MARSIDQDNDMTRGGGSFARGCGAPCGAQVSYTSWFLDAFNFAIHKRYVQRNR